MVRCKEIARAAAEVFFEKRVPATSAVFIIETRNRHEIRELKELFSSLEADLEVRELAEGTITAYAVRVPHGGDPTIIEEIELTLKENYRFSISEQSCRKTIFTVVRDLCEESDSLLLPPPACGICGAPDPFPTTITFVDDRGNCLAEGSYCAWCVGATAAANDRDLARRLLSLDQTGLAPLGRLHLSEETAEQTATLAPRFAGDGEIRFALAS